MKPLLMAALCGAALHSPAHAAEPTTHQDAGGERLPARVEKLVVRDTLQADGGSARTIEAAVALNDAVGVSQFGQVAAPYISGYGDVRFDEVFVEKPDGRRIDVKDAPAEDINPFGLSAGPVPADFRIRRLTVPGLVPGDRLTYRLVISHRPLFPNAVFGEFSFFHGPGVAHQVYELDTPAQIRLSIWRRPALGVEWQDVATGTSRQLRRLTLAQPDVDAAESAAVEAGADPDVQYTSFESWDEMGEWWWKLSRSSFAPGDALRAESKRLVAAGGDVRARLVALHDFVAGQIRYLSVGFGSGRFQPRPAAEVLTTRYADCKGKHALLSALASAAGIEVWPVLVHSSRKDMDDAVPSPGQFDHLITVLRIGADPSQWLWLDATQDLAPAGYLMPNLRGKRALLIDDKGGHVVTVPDRPPFATRQLVENNATLDKSGPLGAKVRWTLRGDTEPWMRAVIRMAPADKWTELGKRLAEEWDRGVVGEVTAGDPANLGQPFWVEYAVVHEMSAKTFEKDWTLWVPLPKIEMPEPLGSEQGGGPVELKLDDEIVLRARVEMPEGMKALPPLSVSLDRPFASYHSTYRVEGRNLFVERVLHVRQRKIAADQMGAYGAFRAALEADRKQQFQMEALRTMAATESLETADARNRAGLVALEDEHDPERAVTLFRQAVEKDPRHKWAWNNLGRALRKLKKPEEALQAFGRQIEINPYDEYAYGNRGAALLFDLNRPGDAEKDFLKQIEVTPLDPDAYVDLAALRLFQQRFAEAAELFERASAADPSSKTVWLRLAWARARAGLQGVVQAAQRARTLDDSPRTAIIAARAVATAGDRVAAAGMAKEALPGLVASMQVAGDGRLDGKRDDRELLFVAEAWRLIGAAASGAGDVETAERYLWASWQLGSTPDTAVDLGLLREKQGRPAEALAIWQQASFLPAWRGNPAKRELERVVTNAAKREALLDKASQEMAKRQVQALPGDAPAAAVEVRIRLLVDEQGRILDVASQQTADATKLQPLRARVMTAVLPAAVPDQEKFSLVREGTVTCYPGFGCNLGLDLYGDEVMGVLER